MSVHRSVKLMVLLLIPTLLVLLQLLVDVVVILKVNLLRNFLLRPILNLGCHYLLFTFSGKELSSKFFSRTLADDFLDLNSEAFFSYITNFENEGLVSSGSTKKDKSVVIQEIATAVSRSFENYEFNAVRSPVGWQPDADFFFDFQK
jgi:membrane-bound metal-dependent hydrolase YbcI (DUF457 family)